MAAYFLQGINVPIYEFNLEELKERLSYSAIANLSNGFISCNLDQAMLEQSEAGFSKEDVEFLKPYLGGHVIWVEKSRIQLFPKDELLAILHHEVAHVKLGHLDGHKMGILNDINMELEADAYAAGISGNRVIAKALRRSIYFTAKQYLGKGRIALRAAKDILDKNPIIVKRLEALA